MVSLQTRTKYQHGIHYDRPSRMGMSVRHKQTQRVNRFEKPDSCLKIPFKILFLLNYQHSSKVGGSGYSCQMKNSMMSKNF